MRGDSLRDLYAKGLALLGLGVLAGVGALVDYWPTRLAVPAAPAVFGAQELPTPLAVTADRVPAAPTFVSAPAKRAAVRPTPRPRLDSLPVNAATIPTHGELVTLGAPPAPAIAAPAPAMTAPDVADDVPAEVVALGVPRPEALVAGRLLAPAQDAGAEEGDGGFFSTATDLAKKAGSTVLSTSSKAGASIVDGLGFVGRKLWKLRIF